MDGCIDHSRVRNVVRWSGSGLSRSLPFQRIRCLDAVEAREAWPAWEPTRAAGVRAGHFEPTRRVAGACLPLLVGLRSARGRRWSAARKVASRCSRVLKCSPCGQPQRQGEDGSTPEPPGESRDEWLRKTTPGPSSGRCAALPNTRQQTVPASRICWSSSGDISPDRADGDRQEVQRC